MPIMATAKSKLFIGGAVPQKNADFTSADFASQTWAQIQPLEGLGTLGDSAEAISFAAIGEGRMKKLKGVRDAGTMELVIGLDYEDEGQLALLAAEKTEDDFAFKLETRDGAERYFIAMVLSVAEAYDTANSVVKLNASLAINSNVVRDTVAA